MLEFIVAILIIIVLLALALVAIAATKPNTFRVQRSTAVKAPPEKIYPLISDYKNWPSWSPYENKDPAMKRTLSGAPSGKGAIYEWQGNKNVGAGRMEIIDTVPPSKITIKLDFLKPFEAHNTAEFTLQPQGDSTNVTWSMHGPLPFFGKVMQIFVDMDNMVGKDFAIGLANLKALSEK